MLVKKQKPVRVQFGKDANAKSILQGIRKLQDDWAKANPQKAHELYPKVYNADGIRIIK
jgi:hypothetical protein